MTNPKFTWFSRISRRQSLALIGGIFASAQLTGIGWAEQRAETRPEAQTILQLPVRQLVKEDAKVIDVMQILQKDFNAPISFIQSYRDNPTSVDITNGNVHDVLNQVLAHNPVYLLKEINGRLILLPRDSHFDTVVRGITIKNLPRLEAAQSYINTLKARSKVFGNLLGVAIFGSEKVPLYTEPATLSAKASVLQHFVELLGDSSTAFFSLHKAPNGYLFWLASVRETPSHLNEEKPLNP